MKKKKNISPDAKKKAQDYLEDAAKKLKAIKDGIWTKQDTLDAKAKMISPALNKLFFEQYYLSTLEQNRRIKNTLEETFRTVEDGLREITNYVPKDKLARTMDIVRSNTQALRETMDRARHADFMSRGQVGTRKTILKPNRIAPVVPLIDKARPLDKIEKISLEAQLKGRKANKKAPYERPPIVGTGLTNYMNKHKLKTPVDIIKAYKNDKSLKAKSWSHLIFFLRQMNYNPQEVLEYAITAVSGTKKRWNKHRIFREYEKNESGAILDMCREYKNFLSLKPKGKNMPLKVFMGRPFFNEWCINNDVLFNSEENFRTNLKLMIKEWNKIFPKNKIREKLK